MYKVGRSTKEKKVAFADGVASGGRGVSRFRVEDGDTVLQNMHRAYVQ